MKRVLPGLVVHEGTVVSGEPAKGIPCGRCVMCGTSLGHCPEPHSYSPFTHGSA